MDVSAVSSQPVSLQTPSSSTSSGGEGIVGVLKDSVELQGSMALKLIQSGLQTQAIEQNMATAQQIIDTYA